MGNKTEICNMVGAQGLPRWLSVKESVCQCRRWALDPWVRKIPWRRKWQLTPVFLVWRIPRTEELATVHGVAKNPDVT